LVSLGIWLRSWWLIGWALLLFLPVITIFLKVFEERELEIRFGAPYVDYKMRTPMFVPRRPRARPTA
jgi:protein-S-isoprenylcysteine O-methyltransferase Ste14